MNNSVCSSSMRRRRLHPQIVSFLSCGYDGTLLSLSNHNKHVMRYIDEEQWVKTERFTRQLHTTVSRPLLSHTHADVMARQRSCPAVSQIWAFTVLPSTWMLRVANSTPMVLLLSRLNSLRVKRDSRLLFPTPESPMRTTAKQHLTQKVREVSSEFPQRKVSEGGRKTTTTTGPQNYLSLNNHNQTRYDGKKATNLGLNKF